MRKLGFLFMLVLLIVSCATQSVGTYNDAEKFMSKKRYDRAIPILENLILADSANIEYRLKLVDAYKNNHNFKEAIDLLLIIEDRDTANIYNDSRINLIANMFISLASFSLNDQIKRMKDEGFDIDLIINEQGDTPLLYACQRGWYKIVECLIMNGADVKALRKDGASSVHLIGISPNYMSRIGQVGNIDLDEVERIMALLLDKGADEVINVPIIYEDGTKWYVIQNVICQGLYDCAMLLITNGADVNIKDANGNTLTDILDSMPYVDPELRNLLIDRINKE